MTVSRSDLIQATAEAIGTTPQELRLDQPLVDQGLDSLRLINLIEDLRTRGLEVDFFVVSALPTLEQWFPALGIEH